MTTANPHRLSPALTAFPAPGVYDAPHMITLLCDREGAEIHYTRDGSAPTLDSPIFDPYVLIPLEQFGEEVPEGKRSYTLRAIAVAGDQVSDEAVFRYDIEPRDRDTFVSEEILPGVRLIRDFENNKMYLVTGSERALLIDAGMSTGDLRGYVLALTGDLPLDVCITHGHPDHVAAMGQFQADHAVHMHPADLPLLRRFKEHLNYQIDLDAIVPIDEGFIFELGDRRLSVYHIPGHSRGCLALLDAPSGILIAGDAIGSNGPTIVDALWLQMSDDGVDDYLSALQVFRSKVAGKISHICGGHGARYLEGETYLDNLQEAAQQLVDHGTEILVPSPRPAGAWKTVCGDRLTDPNWASINVHRDTCLSAPPDRIATLSNLQIRGADVAEPFKPQRREYTATLRPGSDTVEIIATAMSRRHSALTVDGRQATSGQPFAAAVTVAAHTFGIEVVAPDGETTTVYTLSVARG